MPGTIGFGAGWRSGRYQKSSSNGFARINEQRNASRAARSRKSFSSNYKTQQRRLFSQLNTKIWDTVAINAQGVANHYANVAQLNKIKELQAKVDNLF